MPTRPLPEEELFQAARQIESDQARRDYLDQACSGDRELRRRVEALLVALESSETFLESPAQEIATQKRTAHMPVTEKAGDTIGPYKLLQQIGEGGMGVVYMAEQTEPLERQVALKIIKPGMDSQQVIARFEAERQALAMMDHPNIARALDAGMTDTGRPFFVMELVKGVPITEYCDQHHLTPRQRLALFIPVCQAIHHAHQKGIIHRDIKPSNVLVAHYDDRPVPKIIDFGVAKAVERRLTEKTMFTEFGQVLGTVEYMSPEQACLNQWDVDTRSDIYSLGVLLYELLAGHTPFDRERLRRAAFDELLRIIREEEPPRPSVRLSSSNSLASISANRQIEPKQLSALVRGELDWIVMKALEKDRTRRYETASRFGEDVQHYLNNEAVEACPPSAAYRLRKFIGRNKPVIATLGLIAAALLIGAAVATWQAIRATGQRNRAVLAETAAAEQAQRADQEARKAAEEARRALAEVTKTQSVVSLLTDMLSVADPGRAKGSEYTVHELLDEFSTRLDNQLVDQPDVEATLHQIAGKSYSALHLYRKADRHLKRSLELQRQLYGERDIQYADSLCDVAENLWRSDVAINQSRLESSDNVEPLLQQALTIYGNHGHDSGELKTRFRLMLNYAGHSRLEEAEELGEQSLRFASQSNLDNQICVTSFLHTLSIIKNGLGDNEAAFRLARQAVDRCQRLHDGEPAVTAWSWFALGQACRGNGDLEEAEQAFRKSLDFFQQSSVVPSPWGIGRAVVELIDLFEREGNDAQLQELIGAYPEEITVSALRLAAQVELEWQRNADRALKLLRRADLMSPNGASTNRLAHWATTSPYSSFRNSEAAVKIASLAVQAEPEVADYRSTLGMTRFRAGEFNAAVEALNKAVELREGANGFDGFYLAMAQWRLGHKLDARNWYNQAVGWVEENKPDDDELLRLQAEAATLLGTTITESIDD